MIVNLSLSSLIVPLPSSVAHLNDLLPRAYLASLHKPLPIA